MSLFISGCIGNIFPFGLAECYKRVKILPPILIDLSPPLIYNTIVQFHLQCIRWLMYFCINVQYHIIYFEVSTWKEKKIGKQ